MANNAGALQKLLAAQAMAQANAGHKHKRRRRRKHGAQNVTADVRPFMGRKQTKPGPAVAAGTPFGKGYRGP